MLKVLSLALLSTALSVGSLGLAGAEEAAGVTGNEAYPHIMIEKPSFDAFIEPAAPSGGQPLHAGRASAEDPGTRGLAPADGEAPNSWAARNGQTAIRELDQQLSRDD